MAYVTQSDVDTILGAGWEGSGDPVLAVQQANDWLLARSIPLPDNTTQPDRIKRAGAYLAKMAAAGALYADTQGAVKSETVKADTVSVSTEYQDGARELAGDMAYVNDLLRPWLSPWGGVSILRRL
ncbi:hypothetical protein AWR38_01040 [Idiomarina sp. WRN-38]|nr:hypothetical protein AUR68_01035 [Idiomarina sp. H105]OAE96012.1 hypothetical protein AWR38_01040 [Idiomarina sp. WRN-38]